MAATLFVGREDELARLRRAFDAACGGDPRVLLLVGEPGIGKTRLAEELSAYARDSGALVLWGRAQEFAGTPPHWPWVQIGRAYEDVTPDDARREELVPYASELQRILPTLCNLFPDLPEVAPVESSYAHFRLFEAMSGFLRRVSERTPLLLVLDDMHWADRSTLLMFLHLARDLAGVRMLVVGTYRDTDLDRTHPLSSVLADLIRERLFERMHLHGLSEEEVGTYLRGQSGSEPDLGLVSRIYQETEGNPFFLSEVVRLVVDDGLASRRQAEQEIAIPEGVRHALGQRLDRLTPDANALLALAAVAGREFDHALLAALTDHDDGVLLDLLDEAMRARMIEPTETRGEYRFTHALMRETLLAELTAARRVGLHARIAEALEQLGIIDERVAELAVHFSESAMFSRAHAEKAAMYSRLAAEQAQAQFAWEEAASHYDRCLEIVGRYDDRLGENEASLWLERALCDQAAASPRFSGYEHAFALWPDDDPLGLARALLRAFPLLPTFWLVRLLMPTVDRVLTAMGAIPSVETYELLAWKALALSGPDGDGAATLAAEQARTLGLDGDSPALPARLRPAVVARGEGRLADAIATAEQLSEDLQGVHRSELYDMLAHAEWARGDLVRAERAVDRALGIIIEHHSGLHSVYTAWLACLEWRRGQVGAARELLGEIAPAARLNLTGVGLLAIEMAVVSGDAVEVLPDLPPAHALPLAFISAERHAIRCRVLSQVGEPDLARAAFEDWRAAFDQIYPYDLVEYVIAIHAFDDVLCEFADHALLRRILDRLAPLTELRNWWLGSGPDHLRGAIELRLGDLAAAEHWFTTGLDWATREQVSLVAGRCRQGLAEVASRRGDPATTREYLDAAIEPFASIGATLYFDQVLEARARRLPDRTLSPDGLSPREVEVLRLVAAGKSNREIADALVISINTVERHVNHIYTKTSLANRVELASYAQRQALT